MPRLEPVSGTRLLVTGGSRSGKSAYAESQAEALASEVIYLATATVRDDEMAQRVAAHRRSRPAHWRTVEAPVAAGLAILEHAAPGRCLILDCVTLWLSNVLGLQQDGADPPPERLEAERNSLLAAIEQGRGHRVIVTNELGSGVVPMGALTRHFVDQHGWTNQRLAERCDRVVLMVAGVPVTVKSPATPFPAG